MSAIDWQTERQASLLCALAKVGGFEIPSGPTGNSRDYHADNEFFSRMDAWILQAMMRYFRPRRIVEVGCGWSSRVVEKTNHDYLGDSVRVACVDPRFHRDSSDRIVDAGSGLIFPTVVQEAPKELFSHLGRDDILFIDGSHEVEAGSDVVYMICDVLPGLAHGVIVHLHDIFLPHDYPEPFVQQGRRYAEQYMVQAFMSFNHEFEVLFASAWMIANAPESLSIIPGYPEKCRDGGASLWIRRRVA